MNSINLIKTIGLVLVSGTFFILGGCQNIKGMDVGLATSAGLDAFKAATLSDEEVVNEAKKAIQEYDTKNQIDQGKYAKRLKKLTKDMTNEEGLQLNYKAYLTDEVNAFAMADGSIRVYSGLMDLMEDEELLAVIGHEMGHVKHGHSKKAYQMAYAASAARKGVAAQNTVAGQVAESQLGEIMEKVINAKFSQSEESESDNYALGFMKKHRYNPKSLVSSLKKLGNTGGGFFSSHPNSQERAARIAAQLNH